MQAYIKVPDSNSNIFIQGFIFGVEAPGWQLKDNYHDIFELTLCIDGAALERMGDKVYHYKAGDWIFLKPGVKHGTFNNTDGPFSYMAIHFDIDDPALRKLLKRSTLSHVTAEMAKLTKLPELTLAIDNMLLHNVNRNQEVKYNRDLVIKLDEIDKLAFQAHILLIISEYIKLVRSTVQSLSDLEPDISKQELEHANNIGAILDGHVFESLNMSQVYETVGLSRSQCTRTFTKVYGLSPRQYYTGLKLKKAKELLLVTNLTVEEIARQLCFSSLYHFSRQFKRWTSVSPTQYRLKPMSTGRLSDN